MRPCDGYKWTKPCGPICMETCEVWNSDQCRFAVKPEPEPANVAEIVRAYLQANGFDGLYSPCDCGCEIDDLFPCLSGDGAECRPGVKIPCPGEDCTVGGDCPWHIALRPKGGE